MDNLVKTENSWRFMPRSEIVNLVIKFQDNLLQNVKGNLFSPELYDACRDVVNWELYIEGGDLSLAKELYHDMNRVLQIAENNCIPEHVSESRFMFEEVQKKIASYTIVDLHLSFAHYSLCRFIREFELLDGLSHKEQLLSEYFKDEVYLSTLTKTKLLKELFRLRAAVARAAHSSEAHLKTTYFPADLERLYSCLEWLVESLNKVDTWLLLEGTTK